MYCHNVFAWLAAGALGLGSSVALAHDPSADEDPHAIQEQQQLQEEGAATDFDAEQQRQLQQQQATDQARQQSLQGTVIDAASYLLQGEQALENPQTAPQQPFVLLTEDGDAYLILERPTQPNGSGLQPPLEDPAQQPTEIEVQPEQQEEAEDRPGVRSPVRDRLAPRASGGIRHSVAQREQERRWERHPGEWRAMEPEQQQQLQMDEPEPIDPGTSQQQQSRVYQQLQVGQQFTLTGELHERGGLRGIVIDAYGIEEADSLETPMEGPVSDP